MATQTFSFVPTIVYILNSSHNVLKTQFESGKVQTRYKGPLPRKWQLTFRDKTSTINQIVAFYDARKGGYESFYWTPPGGSEITVRFQDSTLSTTYTGGLYAECELVIEEVL